MTISTYVGRNDMHDVRCSRIDYHHRHRHHDFPGDIIGVRISEYNLAWVLTRLGEIWVEMWKSGHSLVQSQG